LLLLLLQVRRVGMNSHLVEVSGTLLVYPHRTILVPASLLLPESIPVRSTISIGVNGDLDTGMVRMVRPSKGAGLRCIGCTCSCLLWQET
jgi:hypothetical protein